MKTIQMTAFILATAFVAPVFAQTATPNIDKRQARQQERVAKGISNGELTAKESANLEKREAKIEANKEAAAADGVVTKQERAKLEHQENVASKRIYTKKHNARKVETSQ